MKRQGDSCFLETFIYINTITIIMMKCINCGYEWKARVEKPKSCPRCKFRLDVYYK